MKILVAVLGATAPPYPDLIRTQKRTWAARDVEGVDVVFYYGADALARSGRDIFVPASDAYWDVGPKTIAFFDYALAELDFDLVFRTNCSTYVDLPNLRAWALQHARLERFYAGPIVTLTPAQVAMVRRRGTAETPPAASERGCTHAAGMGYFLSRDLVQRAVDLRGRWDHSFVDDHALGLVLAAEGFSPEEVPRVVLQTPWAPSSIDTSAFLFRCRTPSSWRRGDIDLMLNVDAAFAEARGERVERWYTATRRAKLAARALARRGRGPWR
jgi:hypothetical protein